MKNREWTIRWLNCAGPDGSSFGGRAAGWSIAETNGLCRTCLSVLHSQRGGATLRECVSVALFAHQTNLLDVVAVRFAVNHETVANDLHDFRM